MSGPRTVPGSSPYPWPYDGNLEPGRLALVIVGWDTGWFQRCQTPDRAVSPIAEVAHAVVDAGGLVLTVSHRVAGLPAAQVGAPQRPPAQELGPIAGALRVAATGIDGFHGSSLEHVLRHTERTEVVFTGLGLEGPVHSTLRSANDRGFECLTVPDACAQLDPGLAGPARSMIEMSGGIFGAVAASRDLIAAIGSPPVVRPTEVPA